MDERREEQDGRIQCKAMLVDGGRAPDLRERLNLTDIGKVLTWTAAKPPFRDHCSNS
jgi:hypothetical protein